MTSTGSPTPETPGAKPLPRGKPLVRAKSQFMTDPSSTRNAIAFIVVADIAIVLVGGTIIWLFDRAEYAELGQAFWYTLQTITTVGYGDVTPTEPVGRLVGGVIMLLGIAILSILTATITSSFIDARQTARRADDDDDERAHRERLEAKLDAVIDRLDRSEGVAAMARDGGARDLPFRSSGRRSRTGQHMARDRKCEAAAAAVAARARPDAER